MIHADILIVAQYILNDHSFERGNSKIGHRSFPRDLKNLNILMQVQISSATGKQGFLKVKQKKVKHQIRRKPQPCSIYNFRKKLCNFQTISIQKVPQIDVCEIIIYLTALYTLVFAFQSFAFSFLFVKEKKIIAPVSLVHWLSKRQKTATLMEGC